MRCTKRWFTKLSSANRIRHRNPSCETREESGMRCAALSWRAFCCPSAFINYVPKFFPADRLWQVVRHPDIAGALQISGTLPGSKHENGCTGAIRRLLDPGAEL